MIEATDPADLESADYTQVSADCDLVMKGGVTSGVVYPTAMCRLAQRFRFRGIGGTSAGALAAALAAAAQHERGPNHASSIGFQRLAAISRYLGTGKNLLNLFQPSPETARLFDLGITWINRPSPFLLAAALIRGYAWWVLLAAIVIAPLSKCFAAWRQDDIAAGILGAVVFCLAAACLVAWRVSVDVNEHVPDNDFGLCTGLIARRGAPRPLTPWLADRIDFVARRTQLESQPDNSTLAPLTFGDLYGAPNPAQNPFPSGSPLLNALNATSQRVVNLEMVTTDVTAGRPYRLPFDDDDATKFFFNADELARFFPGRVLKAMGEKSLRVTVANPVKDDQRERVDLIEFPSARELPVVVAARMSMSFPILFSAVPLYAVDRDAYKTWMTSANGDPAKQPEFRKTWFSDGGLSSNIPIHFFDAPIPRWPTFALNLRGFPRTHDGMPCTLHENPTPAEQVFLATKYDPDVELFDLRGGRRLFQFANSLLDAMRNWNDNTLMQLPGYRERTVEIAMSADEGGLNLTMQKPVLDSIMSRGIAAADLFRATFATPSLEQSASWNDHRHLRLRASLLMQEEWTRRYALAWRLRIPGAPSFYDLVDGDNPVYSKAYAAAEKPSAHRFGSMFAAAPSKIDQGQTLTNEPWPATELRARPRV